MNFKNKALVAVLIACLSTTVFADPVENLFHPQGLQGELNVARATFEDAYYDLVKNGHFSHLYDNNLIIDSKLEGGVEKEGMIILTLIEWLRNQHDSFSTALLKKINDLYFLEFTRFIVSLDASKTRSTDILEEFQHLYHYSINDKELGKFEPFQSSLSKLILLIHMVNESELHYESRKETLALALDKIKFEMLKVNDALGMGGEHDRTERSIKSLVTLLEVYAVRDPLIQPRSVKKVVYATIGIVILSYVIYLIVIKWDTLKPILKNGVAYVNQNVVIPIFESAAEGFINVLEKRGLGAKIGQGMIHGMACPTGEPNPDAALFAQILGQNLANGAVRGMAHPVDQPALPNPDLPIITNQLVQGAVAGLGPDPVAGQQRLDDIVGAVASVGDNGVLGPDPTGMRGRWATACEYVSNSRLANWWYGAPTPVPPAQGPQAPV